MRKGPLINKPLDDEWLEQVPDFLASVDLGTPKLALPHTEVMSDHLLVSPDLVLSGLVDFEPAMRGATEYESVATEVFLTRGDHGAHRVLLDRLRRSRGRVLAYSLLHVYRNLAWYLREVSPPSERTLDALAGHRFGID